MKKLAIWIFLSLLSILPCNIAEALEVVRQKNAATYIFFPIVDADGDTVTGATALDSEIDTWDDATAPNGFTDCTNEATEVGTTGWYYLSLTQTEMNVDYAAIQVKTTTSGAKTQNILIRTIVGDPLNIATTTSGREVLTASGGYVAPDFSAINGGLGAAEIDADAIGSSEFAQAAADKVWSSTTRTITGGTVTTNSDKTGYSLTTLESAVLHSGTAQAGAAGTITLAAGASATNDLYKGLVVKIYGGTGAGQARTITGYDGTTKVVTVAWNWTTIPDATSTYAVVSASHPAINSSLQVSTTASDPWATALPGAYGSGTAGKILGDNLNATVSSRLASSAVPTNFSSMAITAGGAVTVGTNNDKTGYSLTQTFPTNFASLSIDASGRVDLGKWIGIAPNALIAGRIDANAQVVGDKTGYTAATVQDKTGYSLSGTLTTLDSAFLRVNTAQAGAAGSITLDAGASATDNLYNGTWVSIVSGTGAGQARLITGYTGATKVATVTPNWTTNPAAGSVFVIFPAGYIAGNNGTVAGSVGSVTGAVGSVTAAVTVGTNNDKTGYSLTQTFPANFSNLAITATTGKVTVGTNDDKSGYSISGTKTTLDALNDVSAATVWGYATRTLTTGGYSGLTATDVDLIWDEVQSGHITAGTFGKYLDEAISGLDDNPWDNTTRTLTSNANFNDPTATATAVAVWDELLAGHTIAGSAGKKLSDIPTSGTGDWTSGEKTLIKQALGINDGDIDAGGDMDSIFLEIRRSRGR